METAIFKHDQFTLIF